MSAINPVGRKRIELDVSEIERLAGLGLTDEEICSCLGICRRTLVYRKAESALFAQAIKNGKSRANREVANKLYELCMQGNPTAIIWWEKTRANRSDKLQVTSEEKRPALSPGSSDSLASFTTGSNGHRSLEGETEMPGHGSEVGEDSPGFGDGDNQGI
jgi:hypothetical protein